MDQLKQQLDHNLELIIKVKEDIDILYQQKTSATEEILAQIEDTLRQQYHSKLKKSQTLLYITNPLLNNEFLFKRLNQFIEKYNEGVSEVNLNSDIPLEKKVLERLLMKSMMCKAVLESIEKIQQKKDRMLQKSMLGMLYQWIENVAQNHVNINDDTFNPFKSIQEKNQFRILHDKTQSRSKLVESGLDKVEQETYLYSVDTNQVIQYQTLNDNLQSQDPLLQSGFYDRSVYGSEHKKAVGMNFFDSQSRERPSKVLIEGSTDEITTNLPQSERFYRTITNTDKKLDQNSVDPKAHFIGGQSVDIFFQGQSIQTEEKDLELNESDLDQEYQSQKGEQQANEGKQVKTTFNPFNMNDIKLPNIAKPGFHNTQNSFGSSYNYPSGIMYSTIQNKDNLKKKLFTQYIPMRGVPNVVDLTKESILQLDELENDNLSSPTNANFPKVKPFMKGGRTLGALGNEKRILQTSLFKDFNNSLNNCFLSDPESIIADEAYQRKERELNALGQAAILSLRDFKPFQEVSLVSNYDKTLTLKDTISQKIPQRNKSSQNEGRNRADTNSSAQDVYSQKLKQMEKTIQSYTATVNKGVINYPFMQRGIEAEHQSQNEIEIIKKHMAALGVSLPTHVLERAILIPRDMDPEGRKYPKIIDQLSINPYHKSKNHSAKAKKKRSKSIGKNKRANALKTVQDQRLPAITSRIDTIAGYNSKLFYKIEGQ